MKPIVEDILYVLEVIALIILTIAGIRAYAVYVVGGTFFLLVHAVTAGAVLGYAILFLLSIAGLMVILFLVVMLWMVMVK